MQDNTTGTTDGLPDDLDGNGLRRPYDCNDSFSMHPTANERALAVKPPGAWPPDFDDASIEVFDYNCDGWPVDWRWNPAGGTL